MFRTHVLHSQAQAANTAPVCQAGNLTLAHITVRDIFLLVVVKGNANVMLALQWLHSVCTSALSPTSRLASPLPPILQTNPSRPLDSENGASYVKRFPCWHWTHEIALTFSQASSVRSMSTCLPCALNACAQTTVHCMPRQGARIGGARPHAPVPP